MELVNLYSRSNRTKLRHSLDELPHADTSFEEIAHRRSSVDSSAAKQTRLRLKRPTTTNDAVPLVEFHDALSQSTTFGSDLEQPHT